MSTVGRYTQMDYARAFPLDFGKGARGSFVHDGSGLIVAHMLDNGEVCACSLLHTDHDGSPLWGFLGRAADVTIDGVILCSCGKHGTIKDGKWND